MQWLAMQSSFDGQRWCITGNYIGQNSHTVKRAIMWFEDQGEYLTPTSHLKALVRRHVATGMLLMLYRSEKRGSTLVQPGLAGTLLRR